MKPLALLLLFVLGGIVSAQPTSGFAPVNGIELYYEIHGSGKPVVLLHGGGSTIESNWSVVLPLLAKTRRVVAVEEQGHGHTAASDRPFTFENTADDVAALLDHLGIERADVIGFSNGGTTALRLAQRHPNKVNRVVAISAIVRRDGTPPGFWDGFANPDLSMMPEPLKAADRKINRDPAHLQAMFDADVKRMKSFADWTDADVKAVAAPALVVIGDRDIVTAEHAAWLSKTVQRGRLMIVPGGHGDFLGEVASSSPNDPRPAAVVTMIEAFLDEPNAPE